MPKTARIIIVTSVEMLIPDNWHEGDVMDAVQEMDYDFKAQEGAEWSVTDADMIDVEDVEMETPEPEKEIVENW
jgi:hypothetical protein